MSDFALSATLKGGTGYDSPWVVVYANTPDELKTRLEGVASSGVLQATVDAANLLKGTNNAAPLTQPAPQAAPQQPAQQPQSPWGQPQQAPQQNAGGPQNGQPHPEGKQCQQCGTVLKYKSGTSKAGNAYRMWACPNGRARNDGHESIFIR